MTVPDWLPPILTSAGAAAAAGAVAAGLRELLRVRDRLTRIETLLEDIRLDVAAIQRDTN